MITCMVFGVIACRFGRLCSKLLPIIPRRQLSVLPLQSLACVKLTNNRLAPSLNARPRGRIRHPSSPLDFVEPNACNPGSNATEYTFEKEDVFAKRALKGLVIPLKTSKPSSKLAGMVYTWEEDDSIGSDYLHDRSAWMQYMLLCVWIAIGLVILKTMVGHSEMPSVLGPLVGMFMTSAGLLMATVIGGEDGRKSGIKWETWNSNCIGAVMLCAAASIVPSHRKSDVVYIKFLDGFCSSVSTFGDIMGQTSDMLIRRKYQAATLNFGLHVLTAAVLISILSLVE